MASALSLPAPSALETAQIDAESIAQASQAAQAHAQSIAQESQAAQTHAKSIAKASRAAQIHATSIAKAAQVAHTHARNITEALTVSEIRYRRLFESARDGVLILDSETGQITDANPFMTELLGYSHTELLGKELWEIGLLQDIDASQEAFRLLSRDGFVRYEDLPLETRGGERREVGFVSNLYREDGHTVIQCNIRDITERKAVEKALKVSELHYRRLFETARDGILILDTETCRITEANPFICELLGYSPAEFVGKELWEIGLLRDKDASREAFERMQQDGYVRYDDLPLETRRGERREVKFTGNLYREGGHTVIQCNIRDITERRALEQALAAVAARNERIAETLQQAMLQESPEGRFPGLVVKTLYAAALSESAVGGDFFDAFALSRTKIALVVGDVTGKGLSAAARTVEVKYAFRALLHAYAAPEIALAHLNDFICETHQLNADTTETFIVLAVAVVDIGTGEAVFSAAGAEPSLILRADGRAEQVKISGMPLGIQQGTEYIAKMVPLELGETVLMATDGITEARCGNLFFGSAGLVALAEKTGSSPKIADLSYALSNGAREYGGGAFQDDVCLLLARRQEIGTSPAAGQCVT